MKKIIRKRLYDTQSAKLIKKYTYSYFGDPAGFEENLYQTPEGLYFLHVKGGVGSPHPAEDILNLAKAKVNSWIDSH